MAIDKYIGTESRFYTKNDNSIYDGCKIKFASVQNTKVQGSRAKSGECESQVPPFNLCVILDSESTINNLIKIVVYFFI